MQVAREISYRILSRLPFPLSNVNAFLAPSVHLFFFFFSFFLSFDIIPSLSPRTKACVCAANRARVYCSRRGGSKDKYPNIRIPPALHCSSTHAPITLHYITLQYITLYYTILHYVMLRYSTLYSTITLYYIIILHYVMLRYTTLHYITLHYIIL